MLGAPPLHGGSPTDGVTFASIAGIVVVTSVAPPIVATARAAGIASHGDPPRPSVR